MRKTVISSFLALTVLTTSCATIISGSRQTIKFESNPSLATIYIDEVEVGKTPFEIKLARKKEHHVMIKLEGYKTYETNLTKKFNAWYLGNALFGGYIGLIIDPITGAIYKLTPNQLNAQMQKSVSIKNDRNKVFIAASLEIDSNWVKVGQLEKI